MDIQLNGNVLTGIYQKSEPLKEGSDYTVDNAGKRSLLRHPAWQSC
ncbi:hypothetical protein PO124_00375 [Bacillus licheniformis]|nr:hypothetical protein [Bacillus licheniformis]